MKKILFVLLFFLASLSQCWAGNTIYSDVKFADISAYVTLTNPPASGTEKISNYGNAVDQYCSIVGGGTYVSHTEIWANVDLAYVDSPTSWARASNVDVNFIATITCYVADLPV